MDCLTSLLIHDGLLMLINFLGCLSRLKDSVLEELMSLCGITIDDETFKNLIVKISMHCIKVCPSEIRSWSFLQLFLLFFFLKIKFDCLMITNFVVNFQGHDKCFFCGNH